jgi:hypothetical protein
MGVALRQPELMRAEMESAASFQSLKLESTQGFRTQTRLPPHATIPLMEAWRAGVLEVSQQHLRAERLDCVVKAREVAAHTRPVLAVVWRRCSRAERLDRVVKAQAVAAYTRLDLVVVSQQQLRVEHHVVQIRAAAPHLRLELAAVWHRRPRAEFLDRDVERTL